MVVYLHHTKSNFFHILCTWLLSDLYGCLVIDALIVNVWLACWHCYWCIIVFTKRRHWSLGISGFVLHLSITFSVVFNGTPKCQESVHEHYPSFMCEWYMFGSLLMHHRFCMIGMFYHWIWTYFEVHISLHGILLAGHSALFVSMAISLLSTLSTWMHFVTVIVKVCRIQGLPQGRYFIRDQCQNN